MFICHAGIKCSCKNNILTPTAMLHRSFKNIWISAFSTFSINYGTNKNNRAFSNAYRPHSHKSTRKSDSQWRYGNGIISSWAYILFEKKVTFEIKWTPRNFVGVNGKLFRWNFYGKIKINTISWLLNYSNS